MNGPILTPPVISKLPLGLLGFFGIKNGGKYPQTLGDTIVPTLEQLGILAANYHTNHAYIASPTGAGFFQATAVVTGVPQSVPSGELWYISSTTMQFATGAGDSITNATPVVRGQQFGLAGAFYHALREPVSQAASLNTMRPGESNFWMEPGDIFGYWLEAATLATSIIINIQAKVTRFPF